MRKIIRKNIKDLNKVDKSMVDFVDSPFSKIITKQNHINKVIAIASNKLDTNKNTPLAKGVGVHLISWKNFIYGKYIKSLTYQRINEFCNISKDKCRREILLIDGIKEPNLPLNFDSKEGVRLDVGIFNEGRMRNRSIGYNNKDKTVLDIITQCSKKVLGQNFHPKIGVDKRSNTYCIYFPPIFAKHYTKMGFTEKSKNKSPLCIPPYILDNEKYQKIWWQGNLSEEASIYAFTLEKNKRFYLLPRIQLNRVKSINLPIKNTKKETTYYLKDIPFNYLSFLRANPMKLILDESNILKTFDIHVQPYFSKMYVNKLNNLTATYTILLYKLDDIEKYLENIGVELERHKKQLRLLLDNRGGHSKEKIKVIIVKFYKLVPTYLRGIKRIDKNKWINEEDKKELLGENYD